MAQRQLTGNWLETRLRNQLLTHRPFATSAESVAWLGAVQSQDYSGGLWAIGLRTRSATIEDVRRAIEERAFVRTWPMRGTLHFVTANDVRPMLELLAPRVVRRTAARYRQLELAEADLSRCRDAVERALAGNRRLTRTAAYRLFDAAGVSSAGQRGIHILQWLAQNRVICFGPYEGKQPTFVLLDEWLPAQTGADSDEALEAIATRYFASRGPATLRDFVWWTGLTLAEARRAVEAAGQRLERRTIDGVEYLTGDAPPSVRAERARAHLLPFYDEYAVAYRDRRAIVDPRFAEQMPNAALSPSVVVDGRIVGSWRRSTHGDRLLVTPEYFGHESAETRRAVAQAAARYAAFLGANVEIA